MIRVVFDEFLSFYPYCYVYWTNYSNYEIKLGSFDTSLKVLQRAVQAFPLSTDLWVHYLNLFIKFNKDDQHGIISLFEKSLNDCGSDFRSDQLWQLYISWLNDNKKFTKIAAVYDRLFTVATAKHDQHFRNFELFINSNNPKEIIDQSEYEKHISDFIKTHYDFVSSDSVKNSMIQSYDRDKKGSLKRESDFIKKKIIAIRKKAYDKLLNEIKRRLPFENKIKRTYFHFIPLDIYQLDNWFCYLNWIISLNCCYKKVINLFERCLVVCAFYEEIWIKVFQLNLFVIKSYFNLFYF